MSPEGLTASAVVAALGSGAGIARFRRLAGQPAGRRWLGAALPGVALVVAGLCAGEFARSVLRVWNDIRLAPSAALLQGYALFPAEGQGPLLGFTYGPVAAFTYLPAAFLARPDQAIFVGSLISFALYALGPLLLLRAEAEGRGDLAAMAFLGFCLATLHDRTLLAPGFMIHADAPALGFASLACAFLYTPERRRRPGPRLAAAVCVVLALAAKQVTAPLLVAIPLYVGFVDGRRALLRIVGALAGVGALGLAVAILVADLEAMWFHMVTVPARCPWKWGGGVPALATALGELARASLAYAAVLGGIAAIEAIRAAPGSGLRGWLHEHRWALVLGVGVASIPACLLGRAKLGGNPNALAYTTYFSNLAVWLALVRLARGGLARGSRLESLALSVLVAAPLLLCLASLPRLHELPAAIARVPGNPESRALALARSRPGTVYFPAHPLATLMAEGRAYHTTIGIEYVELAGFELDDAYVRAHLPARIELVATRGEPWDPLRRRLPEFTRRMRIEELPGWILWSRAAGAEPRPRSSAGSPRRPRPARSARGPTARVSSPYASGKLAR